MFALRMNQPYAFGRLRDEMERLFDGVLGESLPVGSFGWQVRRSFPAMNFWEDENNLYAEVELPGLKMDDIEATVIGNELTVKGERKPHEKSDVVYHRRERGMGSFSRTLRLPIDIDADRVEARLHDGVLTITLPKAEAAKPRKIEVKAR